jgi:cobalt/nickel transport protein
MKEYIKVLFLILVGLALFVPLASTFPDGLETIAETLGIKASEPLWRGVMPDYSMPLIDNAYVSTSLSGVLGTLLVLVVAFIVGKAITKSSRL